MDSELAAVQRFSVLYAEPLYNWTWHTFTCTVWRWVWRFMRC